MTYTAKELSARGVPDAGIELRRLRRAKGLTHKRLGELAGVTDHAVRRLEMGKATPATETAVRAALEAYQPVSIAARLQAFRAAHKLSVNEAAAMADVRWWAWKDAESDRHVFGPKPATRAKFEALLSRWQRVNGEKQDDVTSECGADRRALPPRAGVA